MTENWGNWKKQEVIQQLMKLAETPDQLKLLTRFASTEFMEQVELRERHEDIVVLRGERDRLAIKVKELDAELQKTRMLYRNTRKELQDVILRIARVVK